MSRLLALLVTAAVVAGCASAAATASGPGRDLSVATAERIVPLETPSVGDLPVTVTDASGTDVTVASTDRIVPLNGSLAEIVFSLGLGDHVVGVDATTTFPEADGLPVVSTGHDVSAEGVLSLDPTVVLADTRTGPPEVMEQLRAAGVPVVVLEEAWDLDEVAVRIQGVAMALGIPDVGRDLARRTRDEVAAAAEQHALDGLRVAFLYVRGGAGIQLLGGDGSGADAMLEALGAVDVGSELGLGPFTPLTSEALVSAAPDVLLVMDGGLASVGGVDGLVQLPGVAQTPAGRDRRVVSLPDGLLLNFGPRTGATLHVLGRALHEDAP